MKKPSPGFSSSRRIRVLFIPGFGENIASRDYPAIITAIERAGYDVSFIDIGWNRSTVEDWRHTVNQAYLEYDPAATVLAGFSFGAMTALAGAAGRNPRQLWLFSLSPYFAEDLQTSILTVAEKKHIGKRRLRAFSVLHFDELAARIHSRTLIFAGADEPVEVIERSKMAQRKIAGSTLLWAPEAGHDVTDASYIATITHAIHD